MGFLSKLFGSSSKQINSTNSKASGIRVASKSVATMHLRGQADTMGLYPSELVMIALAKNYKVSETNYPGYLSTKYEISNPKKMLKDLENRGFIEVGSAKDALDIYKLPELKTIATSLGVSTKGKKADIIDRLSAVDASALNGAVTDRVWRPTDNGLAALKANPYIQYFIDKHEYSVSEIGIDIWTVNVDYLKNPKRPYRDVIFRQITGIMNKAEVNVQKNPLGGSADSHLYCECFRMMGLFIEEEGSSYINAADYYFQYLFKLINVRAAVNLLVQSRFKRTAKEKQEVVEWYYNDINLYPFQRTEILRLIDEADISNEDLFDKLVFSFKRAGDVGVMSPEEAANFIILELSGETDKSKDLSNQLAQKTIKRINSRK